MVQIFFVYHDGDIWRQSIKNIGFEQENKHQITSFKDKVTLDFSAVHAYKEHASNLIDLGLKDMFLKVVSIYGANASGKSNLCLALDNIKKLVEESPDSAKEKEDLAVSKYYLPFEFTKERENTGLELVWIHDHYEYKYGFK